MDATLKYYLNLQPEEALENIHKIVDEIKNVNGHFISFGIMKLGVIIKIGAVGHIFMSKC